jgi:single-strand DNA-binding protein
MSVNKAILVGNLGKDPEVRFTGSGKAVCKFPLATSSTWNDAEGVKQERTEWHNIIVWGKQGENCGKFLSKGRQVFIEGEIRSRSYDDKDGNKRYITEIIAQNVRFLAGKEGGGGARGGGDPGYPEEPAMGMGGGGAAAADDDDIPF